jgi:hypothetical protein
MDEGTSDLYEPLPSPDSIRLIRLNESECQGSSVSCTLTTFELEASPPFYALSYTWGSPYQNVDVVIPETCAAEFPRSITCNGFEVPVTANLFDFLVQHQQVMLSNDYLWIDALCINQQDLTEKANQVSRMGEIYSEALRTIVWLGCPNADFEHVVWIHKNLAPKVDQYLGSHGPQALRLLTMRDLALMSGLNLQEVYQRIFGYARFLNANRWFLRSWIVQEIANADKVGVLCGVNVLNWNTLDLMSWVLTVTDWLAVAWNVVAPGSYRINGAAWQSCSCIHQWSQLRVIREAVERSDPSALGEHDYFHKVLTCESEHKKAFLYFTYLVQRIRTTQCLKACDKIYAALAIAKRVFPASNINESIPVDYSMSVRDVYTAATRAIIENTSSLDYISLAGILPDGNSQSEQLPTWVPDHRNAITPRPISLPRGTYYDASRSRGVALECSFQGDALSLTGADFDQIDGLCALTSEDEPRYEALNLLSVLEFCATTNDRPNGAQEVETLWRTMIGDIGTGGEHPAPDVLGGVFRSFILSAAANVFSGQDSVRHKYPKSAITDAVSDRIHRILDALQDSKLVPSYQDFQTYLENRDSKMLLIPGTAEYDEDEQETLRLFNSFAIFEGGGGEIYHGCRFFRTRRGHLGLGTSNIAVGDQVWVIKNCHAPMVLRVTDGESHHLVGECYLHGQMHGEMLDSIYREDKSLGRVILT